MRDLTLENPIRAIREISHDITGRRKVRLANGRERQRAARSRTEYLTRGPRLRRPARHRRAPLMTQVLDLWERTLEAVDTGDLAGSSARSTG